MEKEITETYQFNPEEFDLNGRRTADGITFRDVIKGFEQDFHSRHSVEYALNLYANSSAMHLLEKSCNADAHLTYGMDLTQGRVFNPVEDPHINHEIEKYSRLITVYGIDSAYMTEYDENGYPIINEESGIYPLTLLIDNSMPDGKLRLSSPSIDDDGEEEETILIDLPKLEFA